MPEPCLLRSPLFEDHGLHGIVSLRTGGVSPAPFDSMNLAADTGDDEANVSKNMAILLQRSDIRRQPHRARQVHGRGVLACSGKGLAHDIKADILTSSDATPLAVRVADCTPILIADPEAGLLAAVHAGWRGTALNAAGRAVQALTDMGGHPSGMIATVGPCIGACCFEIGEDTADALRAAVKGADEYVADRGVRMHADLAAINRLQLRQAGLNAVRIEHLPGAACTCCHPGQFFSYRRDGRRSGRHLAIVAPMQRA